VGDKKVPILAARIGLVCESSTSARVNSKKTNHGL
jgi:hypothetical protein